MKEFLLKPVCWRGVPDAALSLNDSWIRVAHSFTMSPKPLVADPDFPGVTPDSVPLYPSTQIAPERGSILPEESGISLRGILNGC